MTTANAETRLYGFRSPWMTVTPEPVVMLTGWALIIAYLQALYR